MALAGTNYSGSLLSHAASTKCLRSGSQEADLKMRIHVQVIYLKKCSQGRLEEEGENKAGQDRRGAKQGSSADLSKTLQRVCQCDPTGECKFHLRHIPKGSWSEHCCRLHEARKEVSPSTRLGNKNCPDPVSLLSFGFSL